MLEPRGRGRMAAAEYGGVHRAVKYLAYQVEEANVSGYFGTGQGSPDRPARAAECPAAADRPGGRVIEDTWVKIQGRWYRALEQEEGRRPTEAQQ